MHGELYRPLGLDTVRPRTGHRSLSPTAALACAALAAVLGVSLATAFLQPAYRTAEFRMPQAAEPAAAPPPGQAIAMGPAAPLPTPSRPFVSPPPSFGEILVSDPASLRQPPSMAHVPDDALIEASAFGPLPVRAPDGRRPLDVYAGAASGTLGTRIAIIVGGLGISQTGTQAAIRDLPTGVTLAFSSAGNSLERWMQDARRGGHELLLQAPMEPVGYPRISPGPGTLTAANAAAGRFDDFHTALGRMTNYVGVMNYMGAQLSADRAAIESLLSEVGRRGLLYVDDGSSARSLAEDVAVIGRVPVAVSDVLIDRSQEAGDIRRQLDVLERIARAEGSAIGVASAFDVSVATIAAWIGEAERRGITIVPVSALAYDPERR